MLTHFANGLTLYAKAFRCGDPPISEGDVVRLKKSGVPIITAEILEVGAEDLERRSGQRFDALESIDPDNLTPREAQQTLYILKEMLHQDLHS